MNQKGFTTIAMITWAPFVAALLAGTLWTIWFLNLNKALDNICHEGVMKSQEIIVEGNNKIMALNKKAWVFFLEKKALELTILFGPPPAKAVAKARRKIVVANQKILKKQQQGLFMTSRYRAKAELFKLKAKMRKKVEEIKNRWKKSSSKPTFHIVPTSSQLKIKIKDIAPIYKRTSSHSNAQRIRARWSIPIKSMMPDWLLRLVPIGQSWRGQCFSHPHPRKGRFIWRASIGKGNH